MECPICHELYTSSDSIYSTICGHVFHQNCLEGWLTSNRTCPTCQNSGVQTHKIYLNLSGSRRQEALIKELQDQLDEYEDLPERFSDCEINFMRLQEQYSKYMEEDRVLRDRLAKADESEANFFSLQKQYTDADVNMKNLQEQLENMSIRMRTNDEELEAKNMEVFDLRNKLAIMEQKFRHINGELRKSIVACTELAVEKMRLQALLDNSNQGAKQSLINIDNKQLINENPLSDAAYERFGIRRANSTSSSTGSVGQQYVAVKSIVDPKQSLINIDNKQLINENPLSDAAYERFGIRRANSTSSSIGSVRQKYVAEKSIVVKNVFDHLAKTPLRNFVINLAIKMEMDLYHKDIEKVDILRRQAKRKCILAIQFSNCDFKETFLNNQEKLQQYPLTSDIEITEYIDRAQN